jgi:23S rRNA pseudouridine955/2504/2580 synthase
MPSIIFNGIPIRLDRYLRRLYPYLTQGIIEKALRDKQITVDGKKVTSNLRPQNLDEIIIAHHLIKTPHAKTGRSFSAGTITLAEKMLNEYLLYEDKRFIAINKPCSLAAQGGSKINLSVDRALECLNAKAVNRHPALDSGSDQKAYEILNQVQDDESCFKLVHRIDKDTSGILLIAKNYDAAAILTRSFKDKLIRKTYIAVVVGAPVKEMGIIESYIAKSAGNDYQKVVEDKENGKLAITEYKLLKILNNGLSLIEFRPITGRMHQIRVHARALGCPILGDKKYGDIAKKSLYMFLHAHKIFIPQEIFGAEILIEAQLPRYFVKILN